MASRFDLKPEKHLLNPNFESYKLSLEPLPSYNQDLEKAVDTSNLTQSQLTSHHTKLFAAPNHLIADPWTENSVYLVDSAWAVRHILVHENGKVDSGWKVIDIPEAFEYRQTVGRVNVSLSFASQQYALLADGAGRLFLLFTGERRDKTTQWKVLWKDSLLGDNQVFSVVDSVHYVNSSKQDIVECLVVSVEDSKDESKSSPHLTVVTWLTLNADAEGKWAISRTRRLEGTRPFDYVSVERDGAGVIIASNRPFTMKTDSVKEVTQSESAGADWEVVAREPQQPLYTWSQTSEDILIQLTLPADTCKPDVYVSLMDDQVDIGIKNSIVLLQGPLPHKIDVETATWNIDGQKLEVSAMKSKEGVWETLVVGDNRGHMTIDEVTINAIHERLKYLTSEQWNPNPDEQNKPYNTQQLESCDSFDDEECIYLMRIDGETHQISHQATVSYNLLFNVTLDASKSPALCLRHDVDGLLWQPESQSVLGNGGSMYCPWRHVGTLDAFGYVQASKTQRRFSSCSPDLSLVAISDCSRHVYLYRQRAPISTPLRNRRTSRDVSSVAKQHVVSLDPPDPILGLYVSVDTVFLATASRVYAVRVLMQES